MFDAMIVANHLSKALLKGGRTFDSKNSEYPDLEDGEVKINDHLHVQVGADYLILCREEREPEYSITFVKETRSIKTLIEAVRKEIAPPFEVELGQDAIRRGAVYRIGVESIKDAQKVVRDYIEQYHLGAGCSPYGNAFTGGRLFKGGKHIGHISYNGRAWNKEGQEIA